MRKALLVVLMGIGLCIPLTSHAEEGALLIRLRGIEILPANKSDSIPALKVDATDTISASKKFIPEIDFNYSFLTYFAAELILTYPQTHDVTFTLPGVSAGLGTVTHLPPVLTLQFHPLPGFIVNPYVGVGVNLTLFTASDLKVPAAVTGTSDLPLKVGAASVGFAAQVGADVKIIEHLYFNIDAKWVTIGTDVELKSDGTKVSHVTINPFLLAAGLGYRF